MDVTLETTDLNVGYRHQGKAFILLEKLNLRLNKGEMVCFMGPNGIGKSTLIRTLSGLSPPLSGEMKIQNKTINKNLIPKKIAVVLTDTYSQNSMTVAELLTLGRYPFLNWTIRLNDHDHAVIQQAIEKINISDLLNKRLCDLSDGQLQLCNIARALIQEPEILILDEPTSHLDLNNRVEIMKLLRNLAHFENKAILVATHELDLALQTADLIWLAGRNKSVLAGFPEDLVLQGAFDEVFELKGFDLKTGKMHYDQPVQSVFLKGEGAEFLWTKNALERSGFTLKNDSVFPKIFIHQTSHPLYWTVQFNQQESKRLNSLQEMIHALKEIRNHP